MADFLAIEKFIYFSCFDFPEFSDSSSTLYNVAGPPVGLGWAGPGEAGGEGGW